MITDYFTSKSNATSQQQKTAVGTKKANENTTLQVVTFNIQTMDSIHRMHEIVRRCANAGIHVMAIQGTCWGIPVPGL